MIIRIFLILTLSIQLIYQDGDPEIIRNLIQQIKNGVVVYEAEGVEFTFEDTEQAGNKEPAFYRVEVIGPLVNLNDTENPDEDYTYNLGKINEGLMEPDNELFTNPIFVRFSSD